MNPFPKAFSKLFRTNCVIKGKLCDVVLESKEMKFLETGKLGTDLRLSEK